MVDINNLNALETARGSQFHESSVFNSLDPVQLDEYESTFPHKETSETVSQKEFQVMITLKYKYED
jgi:hypothetical protein